MRPRPLLARGIKVHLPEVGRQVRERQLDTDVHEHDLHVLDLPCTRSSFPWVCGVYLESAPARKRDRFSATLFINDQLIKYTFLTGTISWSTAVRAPGRLDPAGCRHE